jgi:hypothetical protein
MSVHGPFTDGEVCVGIPFPVEKRKYFPSETRWIIAGSCAQQFPVQGPRLGYALASAVKRSGIRPNIMTIYTERRAQEERAEEN